MLCSSWYEPNIVDGWLAQRSATGYQPGIASGAIFVAELQSLVVGFGEAIPGEILAVFVDPAYAGKGIGSALLKRAIAVACAGYAGPLRLASTLNAVGFYERFGFSQVGPSVLRRNKIDVPVVIMRRNEA
jgi:GNAT superfamily N-acetyltransferase